jgi:hypothetical protein
MYNWQVDMLDCGVQYSSVQADVIACGALQIWGSSTMLNEQDTAQVDPIIGLCQARISTSGAVRPHVVLYVWRTYGNLVANRNISLFLLCCFSKCQGDFIVVHSLSSAQWIS